MIEDLVGQIETRFAELGVQMTDPDVISDRERYAEAGRAYSQLEPAAKLAAEWRRAHDDAAGAEELISELGEQAELREELVGARERIEQLEEEIRLAMVERDPNDDKSVIVEIQGGAGGGADLALGQACHATFVAGQEGGAAGGGDGDQAVDQGLGQDVGLGGEPGGGGSRRGRAERGLEVGRLGQGNEAGGVGPVGQALDSGG